MKYIGIVGSRTRDGQEDFDLLERVFLKIKEQLDKKQVKLTIVSGGCKKGGDRFAEILKDKYDVPIIIYYPNNLPNNYTKQDYRVACFCRNSLIANRSDILIALPDSLPEHRRGTQDTIDKFVTRRGLNYLVSL